MINTKRSVLCRGVPLSTQQLSRDFLVRRTKALHGNWTLLVSKETLASRRAFDIYDERVCEEVQIYKRTSKHSLLHAASHRNQSHPRRQLSPPQVRGAGRPRRGDPEQRVPVGILEHGVVPGLAGADPGRDGGDVQWSVDDLARGGVGGDGVADGEGACVAEQAGWEE